MKRKKSIKILGAGLAVLMVLLCATPIAYSASSETYIVRVQQKEDINAYIFDGTETSLGIPSDSFDDQEFDQLFIQYETEIDEIEQYISDYIVIHGGIDNDFALPTDLQASFDMIINSLWELLDEDELEEFNVLELIVTELEEFNVVMNQQQQSQSIMIEQNNPEPLGGINEIETEPFIDLLGPGTFYRIWMDSGWCDRIVAAGPWGLFSIVLMLIAFSAGTLISIAISLALALLQGHITEIAANNHGNGVRLHYKDYWLWGTILDDIVGIWPQ